MLIPERYAEEISGKLTCYDRIVIQGVIPSWSYAEGMSGYFNGKGIKVFDYAKFSQPLTEKVRENAEKEAGENGIDIEYIRKVKAFRKDDRIEEIIKASGKREGLVHIFSAMESCNTYKPWHDKTTGKTYFKYETENEQI